MSVPKLFISYCWSSPEHQEWVIKLATELTESGVDVVLDKWNLREGHDAIAFMEKMVNDPEIKKVAMICDQKYASKADDRSGGVGTETQIISKEVYENQAQDKFVAVLSEKSEAGKPYLPTYYKSRIYIDLSEAEKYATEYERLLRWIFDKPLYVKPTLGSPPDFLREGERVSLGTTPAYRRCMDAIKNQKAYAIGAFDEYCNTFAANFERFRIPTQLEIPYDDALVKNIEEFLPFRNEAVQLFTAIAQYSPTEEYAVRIHRLFENLTPYLDRPEGVNQWQEDAFDNYRFIIHELFLYVLAIYIRHSCFERAALLLERPYFVRWEADYGRDVTPNFTVFYRHLISLHNRNLRLRTNRTSIRADFLKQRCVGTGVEFRELMQADFIGFIRGELQDSSRRFQWVPETVVYLARHSQSPLEVFARCVSKSYFEQAKRLLGINAPDGLDLLLTRYQKGERSTPEFGYERLNPPVLLGRANWATRP